MSLQKIIKSISEKYDISKIPTDILDKIIDEEIKTVSEILNENLGILRRDMPQVDSGDLNKAIDLVKKNASVKSELVSVGILKKTQKNMIPAKVSAIANKTTNPIKIKPVIISNDNHIVDGHHRWAAILQKFGEDQKIPVYRIDKSIRDALQLYSTIASSLNEVLSEYNGLLHYVDLTPAEFKKFSTNYKKLHTDNKIGLNKKENMYYGYRNGSKYVHWKWDAENYELHFEHSKYQQQVLGLLNWFDKYKDNHIWGESFIVENTKSVEIWKRFRPQIVSLIDNIQNQFNIHPSVISILLNKIINKHFPAKYVTPKTWKSSRVDADLPENITEIIKKVDNKYVVYPKSGGDRLGTHDTYKDALAQLQAIEIIKHKNEDITIPINVGDTVLGGKFKNKTIIVKSIDTNEKGDITINGKPLLKYRLMKESNDQLEMMKLLNKAMKAFPGSPNQKKIKQELNTLRVKNGLKPIPEGTINEIPMDDLIQIDKYADKQLNPLDVVLTDSHFFDRLTDPRNQKDISQAELIRFFKQLSKKKNEFLTLLDKYKEIVATDNKTNINIPFMKASNKAIAKTIMRKPEFKTPNPQVKFEQNSKF
jgi:hypothetical protein